MIRGFIISSQYEPERRANIALLRGAFAHLQEVEAVYPVHQKIPFLEKLLNKAKQRSGKKMRMGELGCLLSHRNIWQEIKKSSDEQSDSFLVLESDSKLLNVEFMTDHFAAVSSQYDLFFWGAWDGHLKLLRSTKTRLHKEIEIGEPFLKTVYCTYGYSLNARAADYLLRKTGKIAFPVDQFKRFISRNDIKIGALQPEIITTVNFRSTIKVEKTSVYFRKIFMLILDFKNSLICYFKWAT